MTRESNDNAHSGSAIPPSELPTLSSESDLLARRHFESAYKQQQASNFDQAVAEYRQSIEAKHMFESFFNMGLCLRALERLQDAEAAFTRAANLNRRYAPIYKQLSEVQKQLGKDNEAQIALSLYASLEKS
ncbi:MAG TPA: hypothetical protein V6D17_06055 [Candidatus Obscuribacterales bacterium]